MARRSGQFLLTLALLASAAGLLFGLLSLEDRTDAQSALQPTVTAPPERSTAEEQQMPTEESEHAVAMSEFVEMTMRPLFSPTRRPPTADENSVVQDTAQEPTAEPIETSQFMVMGIVIAPDEKVALLKQLRNSAEIVRVKEGQKISDWTVSQITPQSVTIEQSGVTDVVKLSDNVLSATEKQKLMQQAKLEQATTTKQQQLANRRQQIINDPRKTRQFIKRNRPTVRTQNNRSPRRTVRTPTR